MICNPVLNAILGGSSGTECGNTFDGGNALAELMARLFRTILVVGGLALLLYLAWGGLSWVTAGGDKGKVEQAKDRITNAIMGMAVLAATIAIAVFLQYTFGFDLLAPSFDFAG
jgi:ABC-type dipeptide/oligopeptide/nickel transport system permease subunit